MFQENPIQYVGQVYQSIGCVKVAGCQSLCTYTVNHKKRDILFLTITLANLNQSLQFLYHFNREQIQHATIITILSHHPIYVRTLPGKSKPTFLPWFLKHISVHVTATLSNRNRFQ